MKQLHGERVKYMKYDALVGDDVFPCISLLSYYIRNHDVGAQESG